MAQFAPPSGPFIDAEISGRPLFLCQPSEPLKDDAVVSMRKAAAVQQLVERREAERQQMNKPAIEPFENLPLLTSRGRFKDFEVQGRPMPGYTGCIPGFGDSSFAVGLNLTNTRSVSGQRGWGSTWSSARPTTTATCSTRRHVTTLPHVYTPRRDPLPFQAATPWLNRP
eukprot:TRINITY_DN64453_c0_g1_i1.p1 TRINITY_DN64453_c0_g1~~TRINITY_DN64453_c0_g1_i1.p1  ORF type:complete len:177 (-),score=21.35 TRINITY_DN64453_c0_g1_i1:72-578(-)